MKRTESKRKIALLLFMGIWAVAEGVLATVDRQHNVRHRISASNSLLYFNKQLIYKLYSKQSTQSNVQIRVQAGETEISPSHKGGGGARGKF